jgi:hypothetical protein
MLLWNFTMGFDLAHAQRTYKILHPRALITKPGNLLDCVVLSIGFQIIAALSKAPFRKSLKGQKDCSQKKYLHDHRSENAAQPPPSTTDRNLIHIGLMNGKEHSALSSIYVSNQKNCRSTP